MLATCNSQERTLQDFIDMGYVALFWLHILMADQHIGVQGEDRVQVCEAMGCWRGRTRGVSSRLKFLINSGMVACTLIGIPLFVAGQAVYSTIIARYHVYFRYVILECANGPELDDQ